jgi:hypothetical protein
VCKVWREEKILLEVFEDEDRSTRHAICEDFKVNAARNIEGFASSRPFTRNA